ncbi:Paf1-domain-containing protein [Trichodelitschia bisporula]|uniref:Paf1-domain-containing protein n=1 Tax=Trichodelitschia bisporula TaxID=703511 RepID=A0A6G1HQY3_9PEZI|nr:Paf1-domain-containing protein [Trichodelitschia bisporula]
MASAQKPVHQDYIARVRYSNAVPPPALPPKTLDIPSLGLAGGLYTSAGYASRLAREQPLTIVANSEMGMPIDLVGLPGVFDGNESAILETSGPLDPKDRALVRPLSTLGKPLSTNANVSFLRRTEYITSAASSRSAPTSNILRMNGSGSDTQRKRRRVEQRDDPLSILRNITKGFNVAYPHDAYTGQDSEEGIRGAEIQYEEKDAWARPKHPSRPGLEVLDAYPILPDLEAFPDVGHYMVIRFGNNPGSSKIYDPRIDVAVLRPLERTQEQATKYAQQLAAAKADPKLMKPCPETNFDAYLPSSDAVGTIKRKFGTPGAPNDGDYEDGYDYINPDTGKQSFRYNHLRKYETSQQVGDPDDCWNESVALVMCDGAPATEENLRTKPLQKAAYIYPIVQRTTIRPARPKVANTMMGGSQQREGDESKIDFMEVTISDPDETVKGLTNSWVSKLDPLAAEADADGDADGDTEA